MPMFEALKRRLDLKLQHNSFSHVFPSLTYAVYDWCRFGLFTGSRISKYGQSKLLPRALNSHEFPTHATQVNGQVFR